MLARPRDIQNSAQAKVRLSRFAHCSTHCPAASSAPKAIGAARPVGGPTGLRRRESWGMGAPRRAHARIRPASCGARAELDAATRLGPVPAPWALRA
jgi:hypothetical protein